MSGAGEVDKLAKQMQSKFFDDTLACKIDFMTTPLNVILTG